ncbi:MAG: YggT family protein [Clostridia bacterium]|nr:YggT family protein [Clostridia bacterium]
MLIDFIIFVLVRLISLYALIMLIYCLLTWVIRDPGNKVMVFLAKITEPALKPIRRFLWRSAYFRNSPVDFSPIILFFLLQLAVRLLGAFGRIL